MVRKTYSKEELAKVLADHLVWMNTRWDAKPDGSRADLRDAALTRADLTRADLTGAVLTGAVLRRADLRDADLRDADLRDADLRDADLTRADLTRADLTGAVLTGADLTGADLTGAVLRDGVTTWEQYKTVLVPALLIAGGKSLDEVANPEMWNCHNWTNCPTHAAFNANTIAEVPPLYRELANDFIRYFDSGLLPLGEINPKYAGAAAACTVADGSEDV